MSIAPPCVSLLRAGHQVVAFNRHPEKVKALADEGAIGVSRLDDLVQKLEAPRVIWHS